MSDNIKVVVKVRPLISREIEEKLFHQWRVKDNTIYQIDQAGRECGNLFTFDQIYDENTNTSDVYNDIAKPIVEAAAAGFNGTIFAYGQTSSGKTYTMTGTDTSPGLIPLSVINLFDIIKNISDRHFLIRVSYVEIYNETIIDLLNTEKKHIKIQDTFQGVKVDATVRVTTTPEEVFQFMKEGQANRQTGATNMNEESSRSHSIFQITIESREHTEGEEVGCLNMSQLNLVDLAGSERSGQTGATGIRFKEGTHINKSLSSLALVIKQLSEGLSKHVNYRDSKLTRILQNSLGGNAKTSIICAVTPAAVEETISTLQFAYRAKAIQNTPQVNVVATNNKVMETLTKELSTLKTQLESKRNVEEDNQRLQKQIAAMQRFLSGLVQRGEVGRPAPRRATISAPPSRDAALMPPPALNYNPIVLGRSMETLSKASVGALASVPEEPRAHTPSPTPTPSTSHVATIEIIEIDSDDDAPADGITCSPYHKCFKATKTPPCILRKNAKDAEKDLKEIIELTQREKMYEPDVVELLEKIEKNSSVIAKLEEEIGELTSINKDNDLKIETLNEQIKQNEVEVRSLTTDKLQLEERCKEFLTKLTEWEVTYETLKKKSKTRENELLSRLEEYSKIKKSADKCKSPEITVIKARGLSIVDSDSSVSTQYSTSDSTSENIQHIITDLKEQLSVRDKNISELEANLLAQSQKVMILENKTQELNEIIGSLNEKLASSEKETCLHKTTIDTLNSMVDNQKCNLETATKDLQSYNDTIQELRNKLSVKQDVRYSLDDSEVVELIAIEEKSIANNENVANIITSLQTALETKSNEIEHLKSIIQRNEESNDHSAYSDKVEYESRQIKELKENVTELTQRLQDSQSEKEELLFGKTNLLLSLDDLNNEFAICAKNKIELENKIKIYETEIKDINKRNEELLKSLKEKADAVTELTDKNTDLIKQLKDSNDNITHLQNDLQLKHAQIDSMCDNNQDNVNKLQALILELCDILCITKNDNCLNINNPLDIFKALHEKLTDLRNGTLAVVSERDDIKKRYTTFSNTIMKTGEQFITRMKSVIEDIETIRTEVAQRTLIEVKTSENGIHEKRCLDNCGNEELIDVIENISFSETKPLLKEITGLISLTKQKIDSIKLELISNIDTSTHLLKERDSKIVELDYKIDELNVEVEKKSQQLISVEEVCNTSKRESYETFNVIVATILKMAQNLNIDHNVPSLAETEEPRTYLSNHIVPILDKVICLVLFNNTEKDDNVIDVNTRLTEENTELKQNMLQIEQSRDELSRDLQEERENNKSLIQHLKNTPNLLDALKEELKMKVDEIDSMKNKMLDWKDKFIKLELMKNQQNEVDEENMRLKEKGGKYDLIKKEFEIHFDSFLTDMKEICAKECMQGDHERDPKAPLSLLALSCNKIIQSMQDDITSVSSKSNLDEESSESSVTCYQCNKLKADLVYAQSKIHVLTSLVEETKLVNDKLMQEIQDTSAEMKPLMEYINDLQKRILSHKTNLSTLTATTYAENKSLSSQVKSLQHHHTRFHTVCQRDLPELKEQLQELMTLLKEENLERKLNASFKRFSLPSPLENNSILDSFKNESTLDGDLLMLDTNVTLANSADNTLTGHDQTCLYNDTASQTTACSLHESHESCTKNIETIQSLKLENQKLTDKVEKLNETNSVKVNFKTSPMKEFSCENKPEKNKLCQDCQHHKEKCEQLIKSIEECQLICTNLTSRNDDIEKKYNLEIESTEALMRKLKVFEKELANKNESIEKLSKSLKDTKHTLHSVQKENENLSSEIIESLSTVDILKTELETIKNNISNKDTLTAASNTENDKKIDKVCTECLNKQEIIRILQSNNSNTHTSLNRSCSDSESSSRYHKICTLQSEIVASREDCNELKEEVTTIKNHFEIGNLSMGEVMDLDESISDINVVDVNNSCMPKVSKEHTVDIYRLDKTDCYNYYIELVGDERPNLDGDVKIIDVMKMLYSKLMTTHEDRIDNLVNKLRDYEASKHELQEKISNLVKALDESNRNSQKVSNKISALTENINNLGKAVESVKSNDSDGMDLFKTKILMVLDSEFSTNTLTVFESIYNKNLSSLKTTMEECVRLQENSHKLDNELEIAKNYVIKLEDQLKSKEDECTILLAEKEKINKFTTALSQNLRKQEKDFNTAISEGYQKLVAENILEENYFDTALSTITNLNILFSKLVKQSKEKQSLCDPNLIEHLKQEATIYKGTIEQKNKEVQVQTEQFEKIKSELKEKEGKFQIQKSLFDDLNVIYNKKVEEYDLQVTLVHNLTEEVGVLKEIVSNKETIIQNLQSKFNNIESEYNNLKTINQKLTKENEELTTKLRTAEIEIDNNKMDIGKMLFETNSLKESLKEYVSIVDSLKNEVKSLMKQNVQLKQDFEQKCNDLNRTEFNIKTHETTAKIQSNMITRLQKQKEEDANKISEKDKQLKELSETISSLQKECAGLRENVEALRHEKDALTHLKLSLEDKINQLKMELEGGHKPRLSIEMVVETARRRRQSILDSNRTFGDKQHDQYKSEPACEVSERCKEEVMDVDESFSCRSTPQRRSKGRDSLQKEESGAARRRRQSSHDLHRLSLRHTPSPQESRKRSKNEQDLSNDNTNSRVCELQERLASCQRELEELRESYRELDEECETCAEYLRERDGQCSKLKKEKASLENIIKDLNEKLQRGHELSRGGAQLARADVAVNTHEDWANLHSVVVDRMSFDAEVEKNKRLTKLIEDLRMNKQELKAMLAKMQRSLEEKTGKDGREVERMKQELRSCKEELEEVRKRNAELDDECETCAQYLKEKDEHCRRLKETIATLEAKLSEQAGAGAGAGGGARGAARRRRQSLHDHNRDNAPQHCCDVTTQTAEVFLSYQVERDRDKPVPDDTNTKQMKRLGMTIEKLCKEKAALEHQLAAAAAPVCATGSAIVQEQQLSDVMKENQHLKKKNAALVALCKKREKRAADKANRENQNPTDEI